MTDETKTPATEAQTEGATATATEGEEKKLHQKVDIADLGPCRKKIRVEIDRADIDERFGDHYKKLTHEGSVPGYRPGKAPRKLIERKFRRDVADQVKSEVMMVSLQQLGQDYDIAPLSEPELDLDTVEIPDQGPLVYEFEVEVRPQFTLPPYKGLKLKRPTKEFSDADIAEQRRLLLSRYGQIAPKSSGTAEIGDVITTVISFSHNGQELTKTEEVPIRVEKDLVLKDGMAKGFGEKIHGAKAGDQRTIPVTISGAAANPQLEGQVVEALFDIKDVKTVLLPDLTPEFLEQHFGVQTPGALDELLRVLMNRQLEHIQRRSARAQILQQLAGSVDWQLPPDLLQRQARQALARRVMEMRSDGISDEQIIQQQRRLEQDVLANTRELLKEHFVLQKVSEEEKIEIDRADLEDEIERLAEQSGESPRRLRARLEREDMLTALAAEMVERRALDLILDSAEYEDAPLDGKPEETAELATAEVQAVPGELRDPTAPPPAPEGEADAQS
jgi:trigger factor